MITLLLYLDLGALFLAALVAALLLRNRQPAARPFPARMEQPTEQQGLKAGVYGLVPRAKYRVINQIKDCYGAIFEPGEELEFVSRNYLPYHGGHTLVFQPRSIYLQDEENSDVLNALSTYLEPI